MAELDHKYLSRYRVFAPLETVTRGFTFFGLNPNPACDLICCPNSGIHSRYLRADAVDELAVGPLARAVHAPQGRRDAAGGGGRGARGGGGGLGQRRAPLEQQHEQQVDQAHRVQDAALVALQQMRAACRQRFGEGQTGRTKLPFVSRRVWLISGSLLKQISITCPQNIVHTSILI